MLLSNLEFWLWSGALLPSAPVEEVAGWVEELSDLYTVERRMLVRKQGDRAHLGAKLLYFLCADSPKVGLVLEECVARDAEFGAPRCILDLGCGVGATSVGLLAWLAARGRRDPIAIDLVDREPSVLRIAERVVEEAAALAGVPTRLSTWVGDLREVDVRPATDLILCQTALNEHLAAGIAEPDHDEATFRAAERWSRSARTVLIEPALKPTTRALQRLRDRILERGGAHVVAPCPHQQACPMLAQMSARRGDWCHEARAYEPTPMVAAVQARTRRRDERLTYAFQAFAPGSLRPHSTGSMPWRLVTDPLGSRGKTERLVCRGDGEIRMIRVLDKERSEGNRLLVDAEQGAMLRVDPEPESERIGVHAVAHRLAPPPPAVVSKEKPPA